MKILITGASSGIGYETAKLFLEKGHKVVLVARREEKLKEFKEKYGELVEYFAMDVTNRELVIKNLSQIKDIDVVFPNAGLALGKDHVKDLLLDDMDTMIDTNIKGTMNVIKAVLSNMIEKNKGHIVFMGSTAGLYGYEGGSIYCSTKAAIRSISEALRIELIKTDLRVTNIQPGLVETPISLVRFKGDKEKADSVYKGIDSIRPEDIAEIVYFTVNMPLRTQISEITIMANKQATGSMVHKEF